MKLGDYLPEVPKIAQQMTDLNSQINMLQMMQKATGDTGTAPTMGLDHVVNTWVRHQMAYRQQMVQDIQTIAYSVEEIRAPLNHITGEVFRRGIEWHATTDNPDPEQKERLARFMADANVFDQSLEEIFRQFHFDLNSIDDAFMYLAKEYKDVGNGEIKSKVIEIRRLNPALVEFDLDAAGLPKNAHWICPLDRTDVTEEPGKSKAGYERIPAMYKYYHRNQHMYLADNEVIHLTKYAPSETYGWSPILTIFEKALTLIGMDKNLYRYFFERKMPSSMLMVTTDDPESLRRERDHIAAQTRVDPNYIPMVAVSARNNRGRVDMVRLFHTLQEMDYLPVRQEIRERVAAMWGVSPAWQGAPDAFGGLSQQTSQLTVMSRVVEGDQRLFHEKVIPLLLKAFGITDWTLKLPNPEEKAENTKLAMAQQRISIATQYLNMGFDVKLKEKGVDMLEAEFMVDGEAVPQAQMAGEQQAIGLQQAEMGLQQALQQQEMQEQQQAMMAEGEAPGPEGGEEAPPEEGGEEEGTIDELEKSIPKSQRKFKGRMGGITPDHTDKAGGTDEERDMEEYAEARTKAAEQRDMGIKKGNSWMGDLISRGFESPIIKEVTPDGSQMWFSQDGVDYVAKLGSLGINEIDKATFTTPKAKDDKEKQRPQNTSIMNPNMVDKDEDDDDDS